MIFLLLAFRGGSVRFKPGCGIHTLTTKRIALRCVRALVGAKITNRILLDARPRFEIVIRHSGVENIKP
jgi:hypothetical protein